MANFNFSSKPEYALNTSLIAEVINLYGILVKLLIVERINKDDIIFGDYSHLQSNANNVFEMNMLPEISEDWDSSGIAFNDFGLTNFENINLFVSRANIDATGIMHVVGNLVVLPNNKIMEITNAMWEVPGVNNLFTHSDAKSVLKLSCKPYDYKLINELDEVDISAEEGVSYDTLDDYFSELTTEKTNQTKATEITASVSTVQKTGDIDNKVLKPIIDKTEDDVFGGF